MDITDQLGNNMTIDVVKSTSARTLVVLSAGSMKTMPDGKSKGNFLVEFDGKQINWLPNKTSLKNIAAKYGRETNIWIGKQISIELGVINGKEAVIAKPV